MSQDGIHFANDWISDAIDRLGAGIESPPPGMIGDWVRRLIADAAVEGITRQEIEAGVGDLTGYIAACLAETARDEGQKR